MNYRGMPITEFFNDGKTAVYDPPRAMLCWNDDNGALPVLNYVPNVSYFNPLANKNRVVTFSGEVYDHCAEFPKEIENSTRMATCYELSCWLKRHPYAQVFSSNLAKPPIMGSNYIFNFAEKDIDCTRALSFSVSHLSLPSNGRDFVPSVEALIYGVEGVYEPDAADIADNEAIFADYLGKESYTMLVKEHLAVIGTRKYSLGRFVSKASATEFMFRFIEMLGGRGCNGDVEVVNYCEALENPQLIEDDGKGNQHIPKYLADAFFATCGGFKPLCPDLLPKLSTSIGCDVWSLSNLAYDDGIGGIWIDPQTKEHYYTWEAANRVASLCKGWHLPTADEWDRVVRECGADWEDTEGHQGEVYRGGNICERLAIKMTGYCNVNFSQLFSDKGKFARFWSATEEDKTNAVRFAASEKEYGLVGLSKYLGMSVRLVKDR